MRELELKFLLDAPGEKRLRAQPARVGLDADRARTATLRTIYFDTPDQRLRAGGIAVRLRRKGRGWTQTVKASRRLKAGVSETREVDSRAPGGRLDLAAIPDEAVRAEILGRIDGGVLEPVFETRMRRTTRILNLPDQGQVELAIDVGEIVAGERAAELREAELELVEGAPAALFEAARRLFPEGGIAFSNRSKAERGFLLADEGRVVDPPAPRNAETVALRPGQAVEHAARDILLECLEQIAANMVAVEASDDPEGPHQLRVGLRRLRSAFRLFKGQLGGPTMAALNAEARWLGRETGQLRDLDVVLSEMLASEDDERDPGFTALRAAVEARRAPVRARIVEVVRSARAQAFLIDLAEFVETRGWLVRDDHAQTARLAMPVETAAAAALEKRMHKASKLGKRIESLSVEERHELRKRLKKLRYGVEFFAPLFKAKKVKPFLKRLKKLQTMFGDLNDAAMAEALFTGPEAPGAADPAAQRAAGRVIGARLARAELFWERARALWSGLAETKPFWR